MALKEAAPGAAARMRAVLHEQGDGTCSRCATRRPLDDLLIVYSTPLACGGSDTPANIRVMCRRCATSR